MEKRKVIEALKARQDDLEALGARHIYLYGSVARGEATATSDVDLFVDPNYERFGFLEFMAIQKLARELLGRVDITTREGIHPTLRERVAQSAERVF